MPGFRRLLGDIRSVWRTTDRVSALRWSFGLVARAPSIVRTRTLVPADRALDGLTCVVQTPIAHVRVPGSMFSGAREMYCRGVYWPTPTFYPRNSDVVLDLGANVGLYAVHAARVGARVVAVEAQSGFAARFEDLCDLNGVSDIRLVHAIVGSKMGVLSDKRMRTSSEDWGVEPTALSIPELMEREDMEHVDLMKIDIEGSEYDLLSSPEWLARVDRIVMEVHQDFGEPESVVAMLSAAGFTCRRATADLTSVAELHSTGYIYASRS